MAEVAAQPHASFDDYLAAEQASDTKHERLEGVVYAMGATTLEHSRKNGKVSAEALVNPVAIVEVLADSTEGYDRGKKFGHYRRIASLKEYVLVSRDDHLIEVFRPNTAGHWALEEEARDGQTVVVHGATIEVDSIYAG